MNSEKTLIRKPWFFTSDNLPTLPMTMPSPATPPSERAEIRFDSLKANFEVSMPLRMMRTRFQMVRRNLDSATEREQAQYTSTEPSILNPLSSRMALFLKSILSTAACACTMTLAPDRLAARARIARADVLPEWIWTISYLCDSKNEENALERFSRLRPGRNSRPSE